MTQARLLDPGLPHALEWKHYYVPSRGAGWVTGLCAGKPLAHSIIQYRHPQPGRNQTRQESHTRLVLYLSLPERHLLTKPHTFVPPQSFLLHVHTHAHLCATPVTAGSLNPPFPETPTAVCLSLTFAPQLRPQVGALKAAPTPTPVQGASLLTVQSPTNE